MPSTEVTGSSQMRRTAYMPLAQGEDTQLQRVGRCLSSSGFVVVVVGSIALLCFLLAFFRLESVESGTSRLYRAQDATLIIRVGVTETTVDGRTIVVPYGRQGAAGIDGPVGAQGPVGNRGPEGAKGARGAKGKTGPQGAQGPKGPRGKDDPAGPMGITGDPGPKGASPQGPQGPPGPKGKTGAQGPYGKGPTGPAGERGYNGSRGETGPQGFQGAQGIQGPPGTLLGPTGDAGPQGPKGNKGPDNPLGVPGPIGPRGATGELGYGYYQTFVNSSFFGDGHMGDIVYSLNTTLTSAVLASSVVVLSGVTVDTNGFPVMASQYMVVNGTLKARYHELDVSTSHSPVTNQSLGPPCSPFEATCNRTQVLVRPSSSSVCFAGGHGGSSAVNYTRALCTEKPELPVNLVAGMPDGRIYGGGTEGAPGTKSTQGRGGGVLVVFTPLLTGTGTLDASGEDATNALGPEPNDGAGGGGGGLLVVMTSHEVASSLSLVVRGGQGGQGYSIGIDGGSGRNGTLLVWRCV